MGRIKLVVDVSYLGTRYCGWQAQPLQAKAVRASPEDQHARVVDSAADENCAELNRAKQASDIAKPQACDPLLPTRDTVMPCRVYNRWRCPRGDACEDDHVCERCWQAIGERLPHVMGDAECVATANADGRTSWLSVQEVVDSAFRRAFAASDAFRKLCKSPPSGCVSSGRTDRGVHANHMAVFCNCQTQGVPDYDELNKLAHDLPALLNHSLPRDVRFLDACWNDVAWFTRGETEKTYTYYLGESPNADGSCFGKLIEGVVMTDFSSALCLPDMQRAAFDLVGTHDFGAFASVAPGAKDTMREIRALEVERVKHLPFHLLDHCFVEGVGAIDTKLCPYCCQQAEIDGDCSVVGARDGIHLIAIRVTGSGFLRHMVRRIVGFLIDVGLQRLSADMAARMLEAGAAGMPSETKPSAGCRPFHDEAKHEHLGDAVTDRRWKPAKAPAHGLWLESVGTVAASRSS